MMAKIKKFFKTRWAYFVALIFLWGVPIVMLNEVVALTATSTGFKITFMGCLVLFAVFIALRKKIYAVIYKQPNGLARGILLCTHHAVTYGLLLGILWGVGHFATKFFDWWLLVGISFIIAFIFIIIDEILQKKAKDREGKKDENN